MFPEPFNFAKKLGDLINKKAIENNAGLSIWQVTDIKARESDGYITEYRCQIKHFTFQYTLDDVPICGIGMGNLKGIYRYPNIDDFVIVGFMGSLPIILGTIPDYFTQKPDNTPLIKLDEMLFVAKENGSLILFMDNNDIIIRTADSSGNLSNGCKFKLKGDGSFKIYNKTNHGIEVDATGNMTLRGITINSTIVPGTW